MLQYFVVIMENLLPNISNLGDHYVKVSSSLNQDGMLEFFIDEINERYDEVPQFVEDGINEDDEIPSDKVNDNVEKDECGQDLFLSGEEGKVGKRRTARRKLNKKDPNVCNICTREFKTYSDLLRHEEIHSGKKNFRCLKECGKRFGRKDHLSEHMRSHCKFARNARERCNNVLKDQGEKKFKCVAECGKSFERKENLLYHMKGYCKLVKMSSYTCKLCRDDTVFSSEVELSQHLEGHDELETLGCSYYCQFCGEKFLVLGLMKEHLKMKHDQQVHQWICTSCPLKFDLVKQLKKHMKRNHRIKF